MKSEIWIARDLPREEGPVGDIVIFGHKPNRNPRGFFETDESDTENSAFIECGKFTETILLNPNAFPEVTWENSPQRLTITDI